MKFLAYCQRKYWISASIPVVSIKRVKDMLNKHIILYQKLNKDYNKCSEKLVFKEKLQNFKRKTSKIFYIASCKCDPIENCVCPRYNKVPVEEVTFLKDQRCNRKMMIGPLDKNKTSRNKKIFEINFRKINLASSSKRSTSQVELDTSDSNAHSESDTADTSFVLEGPKQDLSRSNTMSLPTVAEICDRTKISDRNAALIVSAAVTSSW